MTPCLIVQNTLNMFYWICFRCKRHCICLNNYNSYNFHFFTFPTMRLCINLFGCFVKFHEKTSRTRSLQFINLNPLRGQKPLAVSAYTVSMLRRSTKTFILGILNIFDDERIGFLTFRHGSLLSYYIHDNIMLTLANESPQLKLGFWYILYKRKRYILTCALIKHSSPLSLL